MNITDIRVARLYSTLFSVGRISSGIFYLLCDDPWKKASLRFVRYIFNFITVICALSKICQCRSPTLYFRPLENKCSGIVLKRFTSFNKMNLLPLFTFVKICTFFILVKFVHPCGSLDRSRFIILSLWSLVDRV